MESTETAGNQIQTVTRSLFQYGLRQKIFFWLLAVALIPATIITVFSYLNARAVLQEQVANSFNAISGAKLERIHGFFSKIETDLNQQSETKSNVEFLKKLEMAHKKSSVSLPEFVKSFKWMLIVDNYDNDLTRFCRKYGYDDIYFIGIQGDILYSAAKGDDLGINLFSPKNMDTLFARACKKSLETGQPAFSDFAIDSSLHDTAAGFFVSIIVNDDGDITGFIAFKISSTMIDTIMQKSQLIGKTAETYLIGADFKMRSNSIFEKEKTILRKEIKTEQTRLWHRGHIENTQNTESYHVAEDVFSYMGPHGKIVFGMYKNITIGGIPFAVLAEIEDSEAFKSIRNLQNIVIILLTSTAVLVVIIAIFITRQLLSPLVNLSKGADRVARGKFDQKISITTGDEIGELTRNFNNMMGSLQFMTDREKKQKWLQIGETQLYELMKGEQNIHNLCYDTISFFAGYFNAQVGTIYLNDTDDMTDIAAGNTNTVNTNTIDINTTNTNTIDINTTNTNTIDINTTNTNTIDINTTNANATNINTTNANATNINNKTGKLRPEADYALNRNKDMQEFFEFGEGLIGQAALDKKPLIITQVPENYLVISSGLGEMLPGNILLFPFIKDGNVKGVIELGSINEFTLDHIDFVNQVQENIGIAVHMAQSRLIMQELLAKSHEHTKELRSREEKLSQTNKDLSQRSKELEYRQMEISSKNRELEKIKTDLEKKTKALEQSTICQQPLSPSGLRDLKSSDFKPG